MGNGAGRLVSGGRRRLLTHVLVVQHPDQQRERVAAEQLVGCGVLGDAWVGHGESAARDRRQALVRLQSGPCGYAEATGVHMHWLPQIRRR
jgi:hypothetical protein